MQNKIVILGAGESGNGTAILAKKKGIMFLFQKLEIFQIELKTALIN